jgi:tetratricopeptide (TPR) repeat protein
VVKKLTLALVPILLMGACLTLPPPPSLYIDSLPQSITSAFSLNDRIKAEDAWTALRRGYTDRAEKAFLKLGTSHPLYHVGLGYTRLLKNDLPAAEAGFKTALAAVPDLALAHLGLAQVYQKMGDEDLTFNELREVLKKDPGHQWAKEYYETLKTKKTQEAVSLAKQAMAAGQTETGKEAYLKALFYSPEYIPAHLSLAEVYKKEKKWSNAMVHLKAASDADPKNVVVLKSYAETLLAADQLGKSLDVYERILDLEPKNVQVKDQVDQLKDKLGIYELPSQYDSIPSKETVAREDVAALLVVKFKGILEEPSAKPPIIIDIATSWASRFIIKVATLGLLDAYSNHGFQPQQTVTRGEMAEILFRTLNYFQKKGVKFHRQIPLDKIQVPDVAPEHVYYRPITEILSYQIMDLGPDKAFRPDQSIKGNEAVKIMDILLALVK